MTDLLRCHTPFFAGNRLVSRGEIVAAGSPLAAGGRASFFTPFAPSGVEQATAAPGEHRNTAIPRQNRRPKAKG